MKGIKYRCFDKNKKEMFYSMDGLTGSNGDLTLVEIYTGYEDSEEWNNYIFMQFTRLLDKNDKEIYEGDILKTWGNYCDRVLDTGVFEVYWRLDRWHLKNKDGDFNNGDYYNGDEVYWEGGEHHHVEIIGNIYENPELIDTFPNTAINPDIQPE